MIQKLEYPRAPINDCSCRADTDINHQENDLSLLHLLHGEGRYKIYEQFASHMANFLNICVASLAY